MHLVFNRATKRTEEEKIYGAGSLNFVYNTKLGNLLSFLLLKRKFISKLVSLRYRSKASCKMIPGFVKQYGIDLKGAKPEDFTSFNDFFTRKQERETEKNPERFLSPADSRLLVHKIEKDTVLSVKGQSYSLPQLLQDEKLAAEFEGGLCMVFRLCPTDYHRYCFPADGDAGKTKIIKGAYDSVNTFFVPESVHATNYREMTLLRTEKFGDVIFMEVGAMLIGKVTPTFECPGHFTAGQEKGVFEYGASTVVLVTKPGAVQTDEDIMKCSEKGLETLVKYGEGIGTKA